MLEITGFNMQNPWRIEPFSTPKTFPRKILDEAKEWLTQDEVIVIIGPRQVGKTTLLYQLIDHLLKSEISPHDIFYFTLDEPGLTDFFQSPVDFIHFIEINKQNTAYVFIDEIQRLENPGLFLKYVFDLKKEIKLVVTGSSSLEIRAKVSEALTGRKRHLQMLSFTFEEFLEAKWPKFQDIHLRSIVRNSVELLEILQKIQRIYGASLEKFLFDYLTFGGYPRILLEANPQRKIQHLQEVFTSYIQKDVKDYFRIENIPAYNNLIRLLAHQVGKLVNMSEISNTTGLHFTTLDKYFFLLENSFIFKRLPPFFRNVRKEVTKMPKVYAMDL
ncbi:MAG: ATP-binding protein, partial [bacterium]